MVVSVGISYGLFWLTVGRIVPVPRAGLPKESDSRALPRPRPAPHRAPRPLASAPQSVPVASGCRCAGHLDYVALVKKAKPAVVHISTVKEFPRSPLYSWGPRGPLGQTSLGTGFVIRKDGLILTNNHVIRGADVIVVRLADDREFRARLVGTDPETDIALIAIKPPGPIPTAVLGDSDALQVGEPVVAIGNPFGLDYTVTAGIVSAKGRRNIAPGGKRSPYWNFIQTDAAINPGNSGGPLLNMRAEVVGINSAIRAHASGIGFAIPINMAKVVVPLLEKHGHAPRSYLGVAIQPITASLQRSLGLPSRRGALVAEVVPDSPAARAGILPGDVIVEFDGKEIERSDDLPWLAATAGIGKTVEVVVLRGGKRYRLKAVLGARNPEDDPQAKATLGLRLAPVSPQVARLYGLAPGQGLVITKVVRGSPGHAAGLSKGEVVLQVGGRPVGSISQFVALLRRYRRGQDVPLLVTSPRGTRWVLVPKR